MSDSLELLLRCQFNLLLKLGWFEAVLLSDSVSIDVRAKILELMLCPDLFVDALRPHFVLVVVTYHNVLFLFFNIY